MAKQLNVSLAFQADTSKLKADIQELQNLLFKLQSTNAGGTKIGLTKELQEAQVAARELSIHLNNAFDANTGKIDLTKFNSSLKASNTNVQQLSTKLLQAGTQGQNAFIKLSQSISQANYPMIKINSQLNQLLVTLKNTARWQLSSSLLHGFMGTVSSAYTYAQNLDESLNKIRIVTNQSDEQMAKFASHANEAAKALSTTTTAYTDAALVFYQQGLNDAEVQERTNAVIKMSNITGDNVEEVSSYMTAIWNNFDDGSESLEHYADVITALGASTASSSAEIAAGLEKFASIGETIGLSYDYATSSLATIVSTTRQSAETVGTGLRTIFSRLQGLSLGETLEDGTDLNKYSKALKTVGVDVLDASGNMREMDSILQDLAAKWDLLTEAQQTALAQTVGGVRQYTTLIALMNNWSDMEENLNTARNSEGALQNQADIYADSWEAAKKRVKASAQEIYTALLDKDLFITLLNIEEKFISGIGNIINTMGGLKGVIVGISSIILSLISSKIGPAMAQLRENIAVIFTSAQTQVQKFVDQMQRLNVKQIESGNYNDAQKQQIMNANQLMLARTKLSMVSKDMTEQEKQMAEFALQNLQYDQEKAQSVANTIVKLEEEREALLAQRSEVELTTDATRTYSTVIKDLETVLEDNRRLLQDPEMNNPSDIEGAKLLYEQASEAVETYKIQQEQLIEMNRDLSDTLTEEYPLLSEIAQAYEQNTQTIEQEADVLRISQEVMGQYLGNLRELTDQKTQAASIQAFGGDEQAVLSSYQERLKLIVDTMPTLTKRSAEVKSALSTAFAAKDLKSFNQAIKTDLIKALEKTKISAKDLIRIFQQIDGKRFKTVASNADLLAKKQKELKTLQEELNATFNSFDPTHVVTGIERISMAAAAFGQVAMAASALRSAWSALTSEDMSWGERVTTILMSISMLVPSVISAYNSLKTVLAGTTFAQEAYLRALTATGATEATQQAVRQAIVALRAKETTLEAKYNAIKVITLALAEKYNIALTEEQAASIAVIAAKKMESGATAKEAMMHALNTLNIDAETKAKIADKFATDALSTSIKAMLGPIGILLAVLTIAITALQAFANHAREAAEAEAQAQQAEAEASQQAADAAHKLNDEQQALYETYLKCKTSIDNSMTAKEQLRTATDELCKALGVEWDALDRLQGKYEKINQQILEARKAQVQETIDSYDRAIADNRDIIEDKVDAAIDEYDFGHSTGINLDGSSYDRIYANVDVGMSSGSDESLVLNALNDYLEQNYGNIFDRQASYSSAPDGNILRFKDDATEEEALNAIREAFAYIRDNSDELGIDKRYQDSSEAYQWLRQLYNSSDVADLLAQIAEDEQLRDEAVAEMAQINAELAQMQVENGLSIEEITDVDSYNSYKEKYVDELRSLLEKSGANMSQYTYDVLNDMADQYLSTYTHLKDIIEDASLEEAIRERLSKNPNNTEEDINSFLAQAENDNTLRIAAQVITDASTTESLQQSMNYIQAKANDMTITAAVEIANKALKEDGMTQEDWSTIKNSGIDWGNQEQGIIQFNEFLAMTYQEQVAYLDNLNNEANQRFNNTLGQQLLNLDEQTEALKTRQAELSESISLVQSGSTEGSLLVENGFDVDAAIEELARIESSLSQIEAQREEINTEIQFAVTGQNDLEDLNNILLDIVINGEDGATTLDNLDQVIDRTGTAAAKAADIGTDAFEAYRDSLEDTYPALENNAMGANMIALANMRLDKGTKKLCSNWKKFNDLMTSSTASIEDLAEIMPEVNDAVQDMLNLSDEEFALLPPDFARKHWDLINDVTNGVEGAIDQLRDAAGEEILLTINGVVDPDGTLNEEIQALHDRIAAMDGEEFTVGVVLDPVANAQFYADCNEIIRAAHMTQEQANAYFANMGYNVEFEEKPANVQSHTQTQQYWDPPVYTSEPLSYGVGGTFNAIKLVKEGRWVPAVSSEEFVEPPAFAIKTITPNGSYGGGINQGVSSKPSSGSRAPKSSGGGGGGGSTPKAKPKEHKTKHEIRNNYKSEKEDLDRYHEIENTLDDINDNIDKYNSISSRAFGGKKVKALQEEAKALKQSAKAYDEYLKEIEDYLKSDMADAKSYGWTFDSEGNVNNYDEQMKKLIAEQNAAQDRYLSEYNAAVDWWNGLSAEQQNDETYSSRFDDMTETAQVNLDLANDAYDDAVEALKKYEETKELQEEKEKARREALEKALDAELEAIDAIVQVKIQIEDNDLKYLKELLEQCGDSADRAADAIALMGSEITSIGSKANAYKEGILNILTPYTDKELLGENALSQNLINKILSGGAIDDDDRADLINAGITEETINKLQSYQDGLLDVNTELRSLRTEAVEKASAAFSEFTSELDKNAERIAHLQKIAQTYKDVIDIVGRKMLDASGELTKRLDRANFEMQRNNTSALKSELEFIDQSIAAQKQTIAKLEADNAGGQHDESIKAMKQQLQDMTDTRNSTYESWLDSWQAECQSAADIYTDTLVTIVDNFTDAIAGAFGSLDSLSEEFSRKQDIANMYLSDYEQIYNLSKLTRDINKSIDETDNVNSKKALKGLMEDIERMQENGVKLSQYDLENLQKQYELELAKQQLSEAQEAKSEVRMTRDSEGNYGYVYTADANAVADAEQNYEDKLYAMQKANGDYINNLQSNIIQAEQDCANALSALDASQFASYEQYQEAVARVQADYSEKLEGYYQQMENVLGNNQYLYNNEWMAYSEMTGYKISANEDYIDSFEETTYSLLTGFQDIQSAQTEWSNAIANAVNEACAAYYQWFKDTELAMADGETSLQDFSETVEDVADTAVGESEKMAEAAEKLADDYTGAYAEIMSALNDFCDQYDARIQKIINSNTELVKSINSVIKASSDIEVNNTSSPGTNSTSSSATSASSTAADWNRIVSAYREYTDANGQFAGTSANNTKYTKEEMKFAAELNRWIHQEGKTLEQAKRLMKFDTGGYTGKWDSSQGKLALLHEKELVLNSSDTENFLKAIELIRTISQTIDLNALSASSGFAALLKSSSISHQEKEELQQNVTITAEFPNATNHSEIEQAFENLVNRAAQFANRKN